MKYIHRLWMVIALFVLAGCSATGVKFSDAKSAIPSVASGKGRIFFYREDGIFGATVQPEIKVGSDVVGKSVPGGFFFVDRNPGRYEVSTATEVENRLTVSLGANETKYVKTSVSMWFIAGRVKPELILPEQGQKDLMSLAYTGSAVPALAGDKASGVGQESSKPEAMSDQAKSQQPAATTDVESDEKVVIQTIDFRPGVSSSTVERLAKRFGCEGSKGAGLITDKGPVEIYRMKCNNGTTFMAQCELRQCRPMR